MRAVWTGTDSLLLVWMPKFLGIMGKWYAIKLRIMARIVDRFTEAHYYCGPMVKANLERFGMKKPLRPYVMPIDETKLVQKQRHEGTNILYYGPKPMTKLREWVYGYDIFKEVRRRVPDVNYIVVDGKQDMSKIYPIIDGYIRPTRHDGDPRMVIECAKNEIPVCFSRDYCNFFVINEEVRFTVYVNKCVEFINEIKKARSWCAERISVVDCRHSFDDRGTMICCHPTNSIDECEGIHCGFFEKEENGNTESRRTGDERDSGAD